MAKIILSTVLLSSFVLSLSLEAPVEPEAKQCLMQKIHKVERSTPSTNAAAKKKQQPIEKHLVEKQPSEDEELPPVEKQTVEKKTIEKQTVKKEPVEKEPVKKQTAQRELIEKQPIEDEKLPPVEKQAVEKQTTEKQAIEDEEDLSPVEKQTVEKQTIEKQTVEKPVEKQPVEKQPVEKQPSEKSNNEDQPIKDKEEEEEEEEDPLREEVLPKPMLALAWELFHNESRIIELVENSVLVNLTYAGVNMSLHMNKADDATHRLGEEGKFSSYDFDSIGNDSKGMLNMIDIGGNLGIASIAAFKKYEKQLRIITVEPAPETFFFMKWNLYTNGVPEIEKDTLQSKQPSPGVLALNRGTDDVGEDLHFCFDAKSSMNAKICDCKVGDDNCIIVPGVKVDSLPGMFGQESISMVKMDCEGCEFKSLPALAQSEASKRILRLAGELHIPDAKIEEIACRWDKGRLMSKCQHSTKVNPEFEIECDVPLVCSN